MRRLEHIESLRNDKKRIGFVNLLNIFVYLHQNRNAL